jgi:hypothetical protein
MKRTLLRAFLGALLIPAATVWSSPAQALKPPDLDVSGAVAQPGEVSPPGGAFVFTFTVTNTGDTAVTPTVTDTLGGPSFASIVGVTVTNGPGTCTTSGNAVSCGAPAFTLNPAPAEGDAITVQVVINTAAVTGTVTNTVAATVGTSKDADGDNTSTTTTNVLNDAKESASLVFNGKALGFNSSDGVVSDQFTVRSGSAPSGIILTLDEASVNVQCGTTKCISTAAEAIFPAASTFQAANVSNPLEFDITYNIKQSCNGKGTPSGCLPIYWIGSGSTTAQPVAQCPSYATNQPNPPVMSDPNAPCLNFIAHDPTGVVTYEVALLKDIVLPLLGGH